MKAARIHAYGHSDQIQVEDISEPTPKPNEVLVKIRAAGVNPVDWKLREGYMTRPLPFTLGQDFCGEVLALGADVRDVEAGEEVYGFAHGAYAEYAVVSPRMFATKPITVDDATAAGLPTPGTTALQIVERHVRPGPGQTVLVHGAAGAVGSIATQLCIARGARVIANASSKDAEYLTSLGVAKLIDYRTQRFENVVRDVDAVIALVGGDTLARSVDVVRKGGLIVSALGPIEAADGRPVHVVPFVMQRDRDDLVTLARLVDSGTIKPRPTRAVPLAQVREAQDLVQKGHPSQKLVFALR
jgi:NADPH:quinone reductase-like Zn-dependent oxidoreductase